jgi:hypothetical protein
VSTQASPHICWPEAEQPQLPPPQPWPAPQGLLQAPQWETLVCVSTHTPLHDCCPAGHPHDPSWQVEPGAQVASHSPQCCRLVAVFTQLLPQVIVPAGHSAVQAPALQN